MFQISIFDEIDYVRITNNEKVTFNRIVIHEDVDLN